MTVENKPLVPHRNGVDVTIRLPRTRSAVAVVLLLGGGAGTALALGAEATGDAVEGCAQPAVETLDETTWRIVDGRGDGFRETTRFFDDGAYRVTRCEEDGTLIVDQTNAPVEVPGGETVLLPSSVVTVDPQSSLYVVTHNLYGDPGSSDIKRLWSEKREQALAQVIPPTGVDEPPAETTEDPPAETTEDPPAETTEDPPAETNEDPPADTNEAQQPDESEGAR